jgi:hypothetical protein
VQTVWLALEARS